MTISTPRRWRKNDHAQKQREQKFMDLARRLEFADEGDNFEDFTGNKKRKSTDSVSPPKKSRSEITKNGDTLEQKSCWDIMAHMLDPRECQLRDDICDHSHLANFEHRFPGFWGLVGYDGDSPDTVLAWRALMAVCAADQDTLCDIFPPSSPLRTPTKGGMRAQDANGMARFVLGAAHETVDKRRSMREQARGEENDIVEMDASVRRMATFYYDRLVEDNPKAFTPARRAVLYALSQEQWSLEDVCDLVHVGGRRNAGDRVFFKAFDDCLLSCKDHETRIVDLLSTAARKVLDDNDMLPNEKLDLQQRIQNIAMRYCRLVKSRGSCHDHIEDGVSQEDDVVVETQKSLMFAFSHPRHIELSSVGFLIDMYEKRFWD